MKLFKLSHETNAFLKGCLLNRTDLLHFVKSLGTIVSVFSMRVFPKPDTVHFPILISKSFFTIGNRKELFYIAM